MSASQEWTKLIENVRGLLVAIFAPLGTGWAAKKNARLKSRLVPMAAARAGVVVDQRIFADLEWRKSNAPLSNTRNMVRQKR